MARLYTIKFYYCETNHTAVIFEKNGIATINLYDEQLYKIIPGGKFTFNCNDKIVLGGNLPSSARNLSSIIISCIENRQRTQPFHTNSFKPVV